MTAAGGAPAGPPGRPVDTLRQRVARGGAYLAARRIAGAAIGMVGLLALTRQIGPAAYGLYAGPLAVVSFVVVVATAGLDALLIRRADAPSVEEEHAAWSLLAVTSTLAAAVVLVASIPLGAWLDADFVAPLRALVLSVPVNVLWLPAMARLERGLRYRPLALIELGGDLVYYAVALGLAYQGAGVWAPVAGQIGLQAWQLLAASVTAGYLPRWRWDGTASRQLLRSGSAISSSSLVFKVHELVNPLIVGRFAGAAAVGQVAVTLRLVDTLAVVKRATSRMGTVAMAKVQHDRARLTKAHADGMALQVLGVGPVLGAFAVLGGPLVPVVFGSAWGPVADVFPLVAVTTLVGTLFNLHSSVLLVRGRNLPVLWLRVVQVALSVGSAFVLVPRYGVVGFGLSEVVRAAGFVVIDRAVREVITPRYRTAATWLVVLSPWLFAPWLGWPVGAVLFLPAVALALVPRERAEAVRLAGSLVGR